jgi:hypothetical protein
MKKPRSFLSKSWIHQLALISAMGLLSGAARADITGAQAQAMAENGASQTAKFLVGVLAICANTYPDMRADAVKAMRAMTTELKDEEATRIIGAVGQCMSNEAAPTESQCKDLAIQLPSTDFDPNDKQFAPVLMTGLQMLEPCWQR